MKTLCSSGCKDSPNRERLGYRKYIIEINYLGSDLLTINEVINLPTNAANSYVIPSECCRVPCLISADDIDPEYGKTLRRALDRGVEAYAMAVSVGPKQMLLNRPLPIHL